MKGFRSSGKVEASRERGLSVLLFNKERMFDFFGTLELTPGLITSRSTRCVRNGSCAASMTRSFRGTSLLSDNALREAMASA